MRTRLHLKPGQRGTKRLSEKYGEQLVCVRYRYDDATKKRYKTVELIVDVADWAPRKKKAKDTDKVTGESPSEDTVEV